MKRKFFNTLTLIGLISFALFLGLCLINVFSFNALWIRYVLLCSLLVFFIGLSNTFKKFTDFNEGRACLNRAYRSLNLIKGRDIKNINYVRVLSVKNQLNNAEIYLGNVADKFDLYELKSRLSGLEKIEHNYSIENKEQLTNDIILKDIEEIEKILAQLKAAQAKNIMIK